MAKYMKKPIAIEATQWFKQGDHPDVKPFKEKEERMCEQCKLPISEHGWVDTLEGGHHVCPSDWIITGVRGEKYPIKNSIFLETYDCVDDIVERFEQSIPLNSERKSYSHSVYNHPVGDNVPSPDYPQNTYPFPSQKQIMIWQVCPVCNGIPKHGLLNLCPVCKGKLIISIINGEPPSYYTTGV